MIGFVNNPITLLVCGRNDICKPRRPGCSDFSFQSGMSLGGLFRKPLVKFITFLIFFSLPRRPLCLKFLIKFFSLIGITCDTRCLGLCNLLFTLADSVLGLFQVCNLLNKSFLSFA